jgi:hypothetical protein
MTVHSELGHVVKVVDRPRRTARTSAINIRPATASDAGLLAELGVSVQALHHEHRPDWFKPADAAASRPFYDRLLADPSVPGFLAEAAMRRMTSTLNPT